MGFFDGLGRLLQGKPVFQNSSAQQSQPPQEDGAPATAQPTKSKIVPVVAITRVTCRQSGSRMDVYAVLQNQSSEQITLDKIRLLNTIRELDSVLRAGETRDYMLYSGERLRDQYKDQAELVYKDPSGDYFAAIHDVIFHLESDKTYSVDDLRLHLPIRDV